MFYLHGSVAAVEIPFFAKNPTVIIIIIHIDVRSPVYPRAPLHLPRLSKKVQIKLAKKSWSIDRTEKRAARKMVELQFQKAWKAKKEKLKG